MMRVASIETKTETENKQTTNPTVDEKTKQLTNLLRKTLISPLQKIQEHLISLRRKHKEEEAEQVVQEVKRQKEGDRESHPNTLLRIRFNVWLTMFIFGESLIGAGAIVHAVGGSHMVVGGLLLAGAITVFVSFSIMVWKTLKGPFN